MTKHKERVGDLVPWGLGGAEGVKKEAGEGALLQSSVSQKPGGKGSGKWDLFGGTAVLVTQHL